MKILLTGQCTLHWGRMEFGNIGNYYIIEPMIRELHRTFEGVEIRTTFQMSQRFVEEEKITILPMEYYYGWRDDDLETALQELAIASIYAKTGQVIRHTPYIEEVLRSDLVIDYSGDMWGDNSNLLGGNRSLVGLCKNRTSQLLGKPTVLFAGSPGPFKDEKFIPFVKEVFAGFDLVTNREHLSKELLGHAGFRIDHVQNMACPAFLFESFNQREASEALIDCGALPSKKPIAGFVLCGYNFMKGPFRKWPREDVEYEAFAEAVEFILDKLNISVCLMAHSNGFPIPPLKFKLKHGLDYPIIKHLEELVKRRNKVDTSNLYCMDDVYDAWTTHSILGSFDMVVSGRVHGAVAALSQHIPTVIIDYGHEPKAHKLQGFASIAGVSDLIADPNNPNDLVAKISACWNQRLELKQKLLLKIPAVKELALENFKVLKDVIHV